MVGGNARLDPSELETLIKASKYMLSISQQCANTQGVFIKNGLLDESSQEKLDHAIHAGEAAIIDAEKRN